jgi:hypothetical protein
VRGVKSLTRERLGEDKKSIDTARVHWVGV